MADAVLRCSQRSAGYLVAADVEDAREQEFVQPQIRQLHVGMGLSKLMNAPSIQRIPDH